MQRYSLPIFLAGITAIIVILGGIIGGASFGKILQRLLLFSTLMGLLGFVLIYMLERWGIDISSSEITPSNNENGEREEEQEVVGEEEREKTEDEKSGTLSSDDSGFTYTVDDEEIEFKPLDESIVEASKPNEIVINGEKIQYDPKKAAAAIRQLLSEDKENE